MNSVHAKWKDGRVVIDEAVDLPEGCELEVRPVALNGSEDDDVESNDPAAIARWIAEFQAVPPLEMTAAEEAEWQAARQAQRVAATVCETRREFAAGQCQVVNATDLIREAQS